MGLYCIFTGISALTGLAYSAVVGIVAVLITSYLFKLVSNLGGEGKDSRIETKKLVGCFAEVITKTGIDEENLGEIKVNLYKQIITLYAISKDNKKEFQKGDVVVIYNINEKGYAIVEEANERDYKTNDLMEKDFKDIQEESK